MNIKTWQDRLVEQLSRTAPHDGSERAAMIDEIAELRERLSNSAKARGEWQLVKQDDLGIVTDSAGKRITSTYYGEAKRFVEAHNASVAAATPSAGTIDTAEFTHLLEVCVRAGLPFYKHHAEPLIDFIDARHSAGVAAARQEGYNSQLVRIRHLENERDIARLGLDSFARQMSELNIALAAAREQALEEAAKVCDRVNNYDNPMTSRDCADAIRALKDSPASAGAQVAGIGAPPESGTKLYALVPAPASVDRDAVLEEAAYALNQHMSGMPMAGSAVVMGCMRVIRALASRPATTAQTDEVDRDAPLRGAPAATEGVGDVVLPSIARYRPVLFGGTARMEHDQELGRWCFYQEVEAHLAAAAPVAAPTQVAPVLTDAVQFMLNLSPDVILALRNTDRQPLADLMETAVRGLKGERPRPMPEGWRERLNRMRDGRDTYTQYPELFDTILESVIDALDEIEAATQAERQPQPAADSMVMIGHVEEIGALENHHGTPGLVLTRDDRPPVTILMTMEDVRSLSKFAFDDVTVTFSAIQQSQQQGGA